jgi:glycosyltransferase involved in cell wall biosynthesis
VSPRVSIVMPLRDAAPWLSETLPSILTQTLTDFELIGVNDHSTDETLAILTAAAAEDKRIRILQSQGTGLVAALNTGMAAATAPFIARMDGDDFMPAERLALQVEYLEGHATAAAVTGHVEHWGDANLTAGYSRYVDFINSLKTPEDYFLKQFVESPVAHPSVTLRASALPQSPYRYGDFPEDYDLWLRLFAEEKEFHSIPETVLKWRDHPQRTSRVDPRYDIEKFYRHKATFLAAWLKRHDHTTVSVWSGGRRTRRRIDALRNAGIQVTRYIDVHPRRIGQKIDGIPVIAPEELRQDEAGFILVYVGSHGVRALITESLKALGFKEGIHFLCAA